MSFIIDGLNKTRNILLQSVIMIFEHAKQNCTLPKPIENATKSISYLISSFICHFGNA